MTKKSLDISRRDAMLAVGGAALGVAAGSAISVPQANAKAAMLGAASHTHYRFKLGKFEVTTILDGSVQIPGPHPIFGQNIPAKKCHECCQRDQVRNVRLYGSLL